MYTVEMTCNYTVPLTLSTIYWQVKTHVPVLTCGGKALYQFLGNTAYRESGAASERKQRIMPMPNMLNRCMQSIVPSACLWKALY